MHTDDCLPVRLCAAKKVLQHVWVGKRALHATGGAREQMVFFQLEVELGRREEMDFWLQKRGCCSQVYGRFDRTIGEPWYSKSV